MTDPHISDDLPLLLTGDATREVVMTAAAHLRRCPDCQQELVSAVIAHASLTSAHRFAPQIVSAREPADEDIAAADEHIAPVDEHITPPVEAGPLPDMSRLFAQARSDADAKTAPPVRHRRRLLAVAAAAVVLAGGGVTYAVVAGGDDTPATRSVALDGVNGTADTTVQLGNGGRMRLDAGSLPRLGAQQQYEVWLTTKDFNRKQPIGFIDDGARTVQLEVPQKVMSQYNDIAVSVQGVHQTQFSGKVVLHGRYG